MTYLFDTCMISILRKKSTPEGQCARAWVSRYDVHSFFISALTVGELQFGISKLHAKDEKIKNSLQSWLAGELIPSFHERILSIDPQICSIWGEMSARALKYWIVRPLGRSSIAATALKHDLIVVTQNTKHFQASGARLLNPLIG